MFELFVLTLLLMIILRLIEVSESTDHQDEDLLSDSNRRDFDYGDVQETTRCEIEHPYATTGLISEYDYMATTSEHEY
jgi:hypothetical protein